MTLLRLDHASRAANTSRRRKFGFTQDFSARRSRGLHSTDRDGSTDMSHIKFSYGGGEEALFYRLDRPSLPYF